MISWPKIDIIVAGNERNRIHVLKKKKFVTRRLITYALREILLRNFYRRLRFSNFVTNSGISRAPVNLSFKVNYLTHDNERGRERESVREKQSRICVRVLHIELCL